MPRGIYNRKVSAKTKAAVATGGSIEQMTSTLNNLSVMNRNSLIPKDTFSKLSGWDKLNESEQKVVHSEGEKLAQAMLTYGFSRIAMGEHLSKLRDILEPHNLFSRFLRTFTLNKRTAYRYIAGYENAKQRLPDMVLKAAMARGMNIIGDTSEKPLGVYTNAVTTLPPPTTATVEQANMYLDQLENVRKQQKDTAEGTFAEAIGNPDELLKEAYRFVANRFKKLPTNARTRTAWVNHLCGMILSEAGLVTQTVKAIAIPDEFKAQRGRPSERNAA